MTALYIIVGILAAIVLPLCVRVCLKVVYEENLRHIHLKWLFLCFTLYPQKEGKPDKSKKINPKKGEKQGKKKQEEKPNILASYYEKEGVSGIIYLLQDALNAIGGFLLGLKRGLLIHRLEIYVVYSDGDAAQTAVNYGKLCGVIYPAVNAIITSVRTVKYNVDLSADYLAQSTRADLYVTVSLRPIRVIGELLLLIVRLLWRVGKPIFMANRAANAVGENTSSE
ncbi:MAG: hypothetical protein FWG82_00855 [Oscillospiraceae bacterium]|nr:hypothetical protein [Oscillospiraceae bacterium]